MNKRVLFLFIVILFLFIYYTCSSPKEDTGLLGIWDSYGVNNKSYDPNYNKIVLTFYEDSVITESYGGVQKTNSDWTFDSSTLFFRNVKLFDTILSDIQYKYRINPSKDSLWITVFPNTKENYTVYFKKVSINPL